MPAGVSETFTWPWRQRKAGIQKTNSIYSLLNCSRKLYISYMLPSRVRDKNDCLSQGLRSEKETCISLEELHTRPTTASKDHSSVPTLTKMSLIYNPNHSFSSSVQTKMKWPS